MDRILRRKPEHAMREPAVERGEESCAARLRPLHDDHPVLPEPPFLFTTSGIEVPVVRPELAKDLRLAVLVVAELRPLDFEEVAEFTARIFGVGDREERVRMHGTLEVRLPPRVPEAPLPREPVERDMECRDLDFVIERAERMFVECFRRGGRVAVPERMLDALVGKSVDMADAAALVIGGEVR